MGPLRAVVFTSVFPSRESPHTGVFIYNLCRALQDDGWSVVVASPYSLTPTAESLRRPSELVRLLRTRRAAPSHYRIGSIEVTRLRWLSAPKPIVGFHAYRGFSLQCGHDFRDMLSSLSPDVVVAPWLPDALSASAVARRCGVPLVPVAIGGDVHTWPLMYRGWAGAARRLNSLDAQVFVSEALRKEGHSRGLANSRTRVIPWSVDVDLFSPSDPPSSHPARRRILAVGHLEVVKGHDVLLEALSRLVRDSVDVELRIIGAGSQASRLTSLAVNLGISDRVTFLPPVTQERLVAEYRSATVLALPSRAEGLPNVVLEALACGIPVVASAVGGVEAVVTSPETGALVTPEDPKALALSLRWALSRSWDAGEVRSDVVTRFSPPRIAQEYRQLVAEIVTARANPTRKPAAAMPTMPSGSELRRSRV